MITSFMIDDVLTQASAKLNSLPSAAKNVLGNCLKLYLNDFKNFLERLLDKWSRAPEHIRRRYAYNIALLTAKKARGNTLRARYNAFIAYLIYRNVITCYEAMYLYKLVSGGESIYSWLRMYRDLGVEP